MIGQSQNQRPLNNQDQERRMEIKITIGQSKNQRLLDDQDPEQEMESSGLWMKAGIVQTEDEELRDGNDKGVVLLIPGLDVLTGTFGTFTIRQLAVSSFGVPGSQVARRACRVQGSTGEYVDECQVVQEPVVVHARSTGSISKGCPRASNGRTVLLEVEVEMEMEMELELETPRVAGTE